MRQDHHYFVYLMASKKQGTLYVGVTNDVNRRAAEHARGEGSKFTQRYKVDKLVWFEQHQYIDQAIAREKAIKKWRRQEKIAMIERNNPNWENLA